MNKRKQKVSASGKFTCLISEPQILTSIQMTKRMMMIGRCVVLGLDDACKRCHGINGFVSDGHALC